MSRIARIIIGSSLLLGLGFTLVSLLAPAGQITPITLPANSAQLGADFETPPAADLSPTSVQLEPESVRCESPALAASASPSTMPFAVENSYAIDSNGRGFAALPAPALGLSPSGMVIVSSVPVPAVLAVASSGLPFTPAQRAEISALADKFAVDAGEPPPSGTSASDPRHTRFAVNAYLAGNEADFLLKQRFGHRAFVRMQMEARALATP